VFDPHAGGVREGSLGPTVREVLDLPREGHPGPRPR